VDPVARDAAELTPEWLRGCRSASGREVGFYTGLAATLDVRTPGCFYGANLMFPPTGDAVAALDWQSVSVGAPGRDLAYFVGTTFEPEDRRRCEDDLVTAYHDELVARGVRDDDRDRCADDYRARHLQGPLITVLGAIHATAQRSERADRMFLVMATRSCAAIRDLHALDLVGARPLEER